MEIVHLINIVTRGYRNPRKAFKEIGSEKLETLSKPFIELDEKTVIALVLKWMANKGKHGDKFNIRIHTEETTYVSTVRIYATRMTVTFPTRDDSWNGKTLYVRKPTDCYHNLNACNLKQSAERAQVMKWQDVEEYEGFIADMLDTKN